MKVRVVRASNDNCWYSECVGQIFQCFQIANHPFIYFTHGIFFYPQDVEMIKDGEGLVPCFSMGIV